MADVQKVRVLGTDPPPDGRRTHGSPPRGGLLAAAIITSILFGYLADAERAMEQVPTTAVVASIVAAEHNPDPDVIGPSVFKVSAPGPLPNRRPASNRLVPV